MSRIGRILQGTTALSLVASLVLMVIAAFWTPTVEGAGASNAPMPMAVIGPSSVAVVDVTGTTSTTSSGTSTAASTTGTTTAGATTAATTTSAPTRASTTTASTTSRTTTRPKPVLNTPSTRSACEPQAAPDTITITGVGDLQLIGQITVSYVVANGGRIVIQTYNINHVGDLALQISYPPLSEWPYNGDTREIHVDVSVEIWVYDRAQLLYTLGPGQDYDLYCIGRTTTTTTTATTTTGTTTTGTTTTATTTTATTTTGTTTTGTTTTGTTTTGTTTTGTTTTGTTTTGTTTTGTTTTGTTTTGTTTQVSGTTSSNTTTSSTTTARTTTTGTTTTQVLPTTSTNTTTVGTTTSTTNQVLPTVGGNDPSGTIPTAFPRAGGGYGDGHRYDGIRQLLWLGSLLALLLALVSAAGARYLPQARQGER